MKKVREIALDALTAWQAGGIWSAKKLSDAIKSSKLDRRDAGLVTFLTGGVLQNLYLLDYNIGIHSKIKPRKLETRVLSILRLGVFQLLFAKSIPANAAVNESVALCTGRNKRSKGYVNAVLRAVSRAGGVTDPQIQDPIKYLSVKYSHPEWICKELVEEYGYSFAELALAENNQVPPVTLQVNTVFTTVQDVIDSLEKDQVDVSRNKVLESALDITNSGPIDSLEGYKSGYFWVQDASSMLAVTALSPKPGSSLLDICAAPGGKTFAAYVLAGGKLRGVSSDIHPGKLELIREGANRLGFDPDVTLSDATVFREDLVNSFDYIICDVPCSGLGIVRKKPDIRYNSEESVGELPQLQHLILTNASKYLKAGGTLLYSTCTWRSAENSQVVERFLQENRGFSMVNYELPPPIGRVETGKMTLWPHLFGVDGFFICLLRKNNV